jgi:hypothetical protein
MAMTIARDRQLSSKLCANFECCTTTKLVRWRLTPQRRSQIDAVSTWVKRAPHFPSTSIAANDNVCRQIK